MKFKIPTLLLPILAMLALCWPSQANAQGCPGIPVNLSLSNLNISSAQEYKASNAITVGPTVSITQAVNVDIIATNEITFKANFSMVSGSTLEARLVNPCNTSKVADAGEQAGRTGEPEANPWIDQPAIMQGFPNPFIGQTTLRFSLPDAETVNLQVYNLKGEHIATLFEGNLKAGQAAEVTFEPTDLAAGIYLARLSTASGKSLSYRLMLQL